MHNKTVYKFISGLTLLGLVILLVTLYNFQFVKQLTLKSSPVTTTQAADLANGYGVVAPIPSLSASTQQAAVNKAVDGGYGWVRYEFNYTDPMGFTVYDEAHQKIKASGLKTLGLLMYPGSGKSHDEWKNYVNSVVSHYGSEIAAWEIMNEADNYLSASDYVSFLSEASDIIRGINPGAKIISSGLTSRIEATSYLDGIQAAGGWGKFDAVGIHVYHSGNPEKVNFGGGDVVAELDRISGSINKNGGGKNIWITELGYQSGVVGESSQANWLARTFIMLKSVFRVEKIFPYSLLDGGGDSYGLLTNSLGEKQSFKTLKSIISSLGGLGTGIKLIPQSKTVLDSLDSVDKWDTSGTSNGTTTLSSVSGHSSNGMKIEYNFTADSAYAVAEKNISISGTPTAIGAWIYGDDSKNVWKFRFKDKNSETFQADLGSISSNWDYKQFSIGTDTAFTSWGGDGKIDFPISFNAIVLDRQGGPASGSGIIDDITAITGSADLYAYQFNSTVAWWKASGTDTANLCGASREFREDPQFASGVNCSDTPVTTSSPTSATSSSSSTKSTKRAASRPAIAAPVPDKDKSTVRVDGDKVVADGKSNYRIVIVVKDKDGAVLKGYKPQLSTDQPDIVKISDPILIGNEWISEITSTTEGVKTIKIKVGNIQLNDVNLTYIPVPPPPTLSVPTPAAKPMEVAPPVIKKTNYWPAIILSGGAIIAGLVSCMLIFTKSGRRMILLIKSKFIHS